MQLQQRWDRFLLVQEQRFHRRLAPVGRPGHDQIKQRAAQAVDIGSMIDERRIEGLLRRHEIDRPQDAPRLGQRRFLTVGVAEEVRAANQSQVGDLERPVGIQQQVRRFDIAMNDPLLVRVLQAASRLQDQRRRQLRRQRTAQPHQPVEVGSLDKLHHEVVPRLTDVGIVSGHDVGMRQPRCRLDFALETLHERLVVAEARGQHFDSDDPLHAAMPSFVDRPHAAAAQLFEDVVVADLQIAEPPVANRPRLKRSQPTLRRE